MSQVDTGLRGCAPAEAAALAYRIGQSDSLSLRAITGYSSWYARDHSRNWLPLDLIGRQEADLLTGVRAALLADASLSRPDVMCGSTAIAEGTLAVEGVDEVAEPARATGFRCEA